MQLADLGADGIKIEDPAVGGDVGRAVPPYQENGSSLFFEGFNRNKRSIALDLRQRPAVTSSRISRANPTRSSRTFAAMGRRSSASATTT
jgi:crotonobetainyl-CoA:carnitine CoA-transferase CaiB-like acyl-CoA transferase